MNKLSNQTHDYDNKLLEHYKNLIKNDKGKIITFDKTLDRIFIDLKRMRNKYIEFKKISNIVLSGLTLLDNDRNNNYDNTNDIKVEELLPRVWNCVKDYDDSGKFIFYEQIVDIVISGSCAQGRCIRLLQFYNI
jgi:hypothetical protein